MANYFNVPVFEVEIDDHLQILDEWVEDLKANLAFCGNPIIEHMGKQIIFLVQQVEIEIKHIKNELVVADIIKTQEDKQKENELFEFFERSSKDFYKKIQRV